MDDPADAAGNRERVMTVCCHVFVEPRPPVGECRIDVRGYRTYLLGSLVDQATEKRCRVFRRRRCDLRKNMLRDLFDGEEDGKDQAEDRVMENNFVGGDLEGIGSPHCRGGERRTGRRRANSGKPAALQTSIERRTAQLRHQTFESIMRVVEREAGAPPVGENDRFVFIGEKTCAGSLRPHSLVGREVSRLPFGDRLAIDAVSLGENDVRLLAGLNRASDSWRCRRTGMRSSLHRLAGLSRHSSFPVSTCNYRHAQNGHTHTISPDRLDDAFVQSSPIRDNNLLAAEALGPKNAGAEQPFQARSPAQNLLEHRMNDLSDDLFHSKLEFFIDSRTLDSIKPLPCDRWVALSAMQKSIRRGDSPTAQRALRTLYQHDPSSTWRRLLVIACEDVGIGALGTVMMAARRCANVKALCEKGRDGAAALVTAQMLAEAPKERSADLLFAVALRDPALEIMRSRCRSVSVSRRLEFVEDPTLSLPERRSRRLAFFRNRVAGRTTGWSRPPGRSLANLRRARHS
jgi:hypothetical protein